MTMIDDLLTGRQSPADVTRDTLSKSITQATGLTSYDLQDKATQLYPTITPLRNNIARVAGTGTATHWNAITGINTTGVALGLSEGHRGGVLTTTTRQYTAVYKSFGFDDNVTFEADMAAQGFQDVKDIAVTNLLRSVMIAEENMIIGGNASLALGITPTPSLVASGSASALTASSYTVQVVALTHRAYANSSVAAGVPTSITRTNADNSTDTYGGGSAQVSTASTITPTAGQNITATVAAVPGAVGYAWYWGTGGTAVLGAITSTNQVVISGAATGTQAASTVNADNSTNALAFDGLISQICTPGNGSYYQALPAGQVLQTDGAVGIVQINTALRSFWDNYRLSPDLMLVSSQELGNISRLVLANGGAPIIRFNTDNSGGPLTAGAVVGNYLSPFTMSGGASIDIMLHPNVTPGTILFISRRVPYPLSNVGNVLQMKTRRDYYQIEWPLRTRMYEYGVYFDGVLQNYFPPAFGMITNITSN